MTEISHSLSSYAPTGWYDVCAVEPQRDLVRIYDRDGRHVGGQLCWSNQTYALVGALRAEGRRLTPRSKAITNNFSEER